MEVTFEKISDEKSGIKIYDIEIPNFPPGVTIVIPMYDKLVAVSKSYTVKFM